MASAINTGELVLNEKAGNILKLAVLEARMQHTQRVDEQHLLLAILHDSVNNGAKQVLESNNMNYEDTFTLLQQKSGIQNGIGLPDEEDDDLLEPSGGNGSGNAASQKSQATQTQKPGGKTPVLDNFGIDLTKAAAEGKLDPVVGREREITRVVEILGRRKKNNPILIGAPEWAKVPSWRDWRR